MDLIADYNYTLPSELIATHPLAERSASRLFCIPRDGDQWVHANFKDILSKFNRGDCMVLNDTRVIPARVYGRKKASGGRVECLLERIEANNQAWVQWRASKAPRAGAQWILDGEVEVSILQREAGYCLLQFPYSPFTYFHKHGEMPLPPYMRREAEESDLERYQTVFAREDGAVAAPTAGLHFDQALLDALSKKGVLIERVTLHVGSGTFAPVRVENLDDHIMHEERCAVSADVWQRIQNVRKNGGKIIAVGTTVVRTLESAAQYFNENTHAVEAGFFAKSKLFIRPGFKFQCVDSLITNFHLPKSTLLCLVSAMVGLPRLLRAYTAAIDEKYRFYSYGDAMYIEDFLTK